MKKLVGLLLFFNVFVVLAQGGINSYNFGQTPQAAMLNPAYNIETNYHFTLPIIGSHNIILESTGMTAYDVIGTNSIPFQDKVENTVYQLVANDYFLLNQKMEFLNMGQRLNNDAYLSYGFYEELDLFSTLPVELFHLFYEGTSIPGKEYKIDDVVMQSNLLMVYHVGLQKSITKKLDLGIRFKVYNAAYDLQATSNKGNFNSNITADNIYSHSLSDIDITIRTSGFAVQYDADNDPIKDQNGDIILENNSGDDLYFEDYFKGGYIANKTFFNGNKGVGIDLGLTYQMKENLVLAASINDLGAIFNNNQVRTYAYKGDYTSQGLAFEYDSPIGYVQRLEDELNEYIPLTIEGNNYTSLRPFHVNAFAAYSFNKKRSNVCELYKSVSYSYASIFGALIHAQNRPNQILYDASFFYERNFNDIVQARLNYTVNKYSASNVGLAVSAHLWKINLFAGVNNVLGLTNLAKANNISAQLGIHVMIK